MVEFNDWQGYCFANLKFKSYQDFCKEARLVLNFYKNRPEGYKLFKESYKRTKNENNQ